MDFDYRGKFRGTVQEQAGLREEGLAKGIVNVNDNDARFWTDWYDEKIWNADSRFGTFMAGLKELGLLDDTVIVVTSDHGTEFYEYKRFDHGHTLFQELVNVPLLVRSPKLTGGKIVYSVISTLDIMPTVLDMVGIKPDKTLEAQMKGISLVPAFKGEDVSWDVYT